jgi:hypothetical protein
MTQRRKLGIMVSFYVDLFLIFSWKKISLIVQLVFIPIYHIDKDKQEEAIRKLIRVTKPGNLVIIVYSNLHTIIRYLLLPIHFIRMIKKLLRKNKEGEGKDLYYFTHPIRWWDRFRDVADIQIVPWRSFGSNYQKRLIPNNKFSKHMFYILFNMEERFPNFFVKYFQYPMIVLTKRKSQQWDELGQGKAGAYSCRLPRLL